MPGGEAAEKEVMKMIGLRVGHPVEIVDSGDHDLIFLKEYVGDWMDHVIVTKEMIGFPPIPHYLTIWCDDHGIMKNLPVNRLATSFRGVFLLTDMPLVGDCIISWDSENTTLDVPQKFINLAEAIEKAVP